MALQSCHFFTKHQHQHQININALINNLTISSATMASWTIPPFEIRLAIFMHFVDDVIHNAAQPRNCEADVFRVHPTHYVKIRAAAAVRRLLVFAPELQATVHQKLKGRMLQLKMAQLNLSEENCSQSEFLRRKSTRLTLEAWK